jgi:hypothetical protein
VLYLQHRTGLRILTSAMGDATLGVLFIASFLKTRLAALQSRRVQS